MAENKQEKSTHPLRDNIEVIVFAVVMALGLKVFAIEAYQIPTGSMMPTLMGTSLLDATTKTRDGSIHDRVLVDKLSFLLRDPERFEVVVFRYPLVTHNNYVKRCVGLPNEWLMIHQGDIWTHGPDEEEFQIRRKPASLQETLWKRSFPVTESRDLPWRHWRGSGTWVSESNESGVLRGNSSLEFARTVRDDYSDGYPDSIRNRVPTTGHGLTSYNPVADLKVEGSAQGDTDSSSLGIRLECGPYITEMSIPNAAGGKLEVLLPDGNSESFAIEAYQGEVEYSLAFWDHTVRFTLDGPGISVDEIRELTLERFDDSLRNRIAFQSSKGQWRLGLPTVYRDIHYLPPNNNQTALFEIPEGEYFMMGDNTQNSLDSRDFESRVLTLREPVGGRRTLRGDHMREQQADDPRMANPRFDRERQLMTFRDENGEIYQFDKSNIESDLQVFAPTVPRGNIIGKALFVFLPVPPFSPTVRIRAVR